MALSYIGPFSFHQMSRLPSRQIPRFDAVTRAGVNGWVLWWEGNRGDPFVVRTTLLSSTVQSAYNALYYYEQMIGYDVEVKWAGLSEPGHVYTVMNVSRLNLTPVLYGISTTGGYLARSVYEWTLLPRTLPQQDDD